MSQDTEPQYELISQLQRELEELRDKYDTLSSDTNVIKLEREALKTELEQIKNENQELSESNTELQHLTETMEMERNHLLRPTLDQLQSFDEDKTDLKSQLAEQQANMKKLNTLNSQIQKENEKYKLGLEKYDSQLRKKEENSQTRINTLTAQIQQLQIDNEELNKKLLKSELDLYALRKHGQSLQDEEKVSPLLGHMQNDTVEIEVTDLEGLFDDNTATDNAEQNDQDTPTMQPVILTSGRSTSNVNGRKTSIILTLNDLASVMGKREYRHSRPSLGSLQIIDSEKDVFNDLKRVLLSKKSELDVLSDIDGDELDLDDAEQAAEEEDDVVSDLEQEDDGKMVESEDMKKNEEMKKKDEEIEQLKMENKQLIATHSEIQETLKVQIERKDKEIKDKKARIENLREQKRSLEMKVAKKSCNLIPWCSN